MQTDVSLNVKINCIVRESNNPRFWVALFLYPCKWLFAKNVTKNHRNSFKNFQIHVSILLTRHYLHLYSHWPFKLLDLSYFQVWDPNDVKELSLFSHLLQQYRFLFRLVQVHVDDLFQRRTETPHTHTHTHTTTTTTTTSIFVTNIPVKLCKMREKWGAGMFVLMSLHFISESVIHRQFYCRGSVPNIVSIF